MAADAWSSEESPPHCVINTTEPGGRFECRNCGQAYTPAMPCGMDMYVAMMGSWIGTHQKCVLRTTGRQGPAEPPSKEDHEEMRGEEMRGEELPESG